MSPPDPAVGQPGGRLECLGRWLENALLCVLLFAMIGLAAYQPLLRQLAGQGLLLGDEALRLLVLWSALVGAVAAARDDVHLRIDAASRFLPGRGRIVAALLVDTFSAGVALALAWYSWKFVLESREFGDELLGGRPAWLFQLVLPVAFSLIAWRYAVWGLRRGRELFAPGGGAAPRP